MKKTAKNMQTALTGRPEISEYFFAGLNEGGASIEPSAKKKKKKYQHSFLLQLHC